MGLYYKIYDGKVLRIALQVGWEINRKQVITLIFL